MFRRVNTSYVYRINITVFDGGLEELIFSKLNGIFFLKFAKGILRINLCRQSERGRRDIEE